MLLDVVTVPAFADGRAAVLLKMNEQRSGASCQQELCCLSLRIEPKSFFSFAFQNELNGFAQILETFLLCLTLSVRSRDLEACSPKSAL
jgi:hypothetical protein